MKSEYLKNLRDLSAEIDELNETESNRDKMNKILYKAEEIVGVFNKQRSMYPNNRKELTLDQSELLELRSIIREIWKKAEAIDLVPRPEPDIDFSSLPDQPR